MAAFAASCAEAVADSLAYVDRTEPAGSVACADELAGCSAAPRLASCCLARAFGCELGDPGTFAASRRDCAAGSSDFQGGRCFAYCRCLCWPADCSVSPVRCSDAPNPFQDDPADCFPDGQRCA